MKQVCLLIAIYGWAAFHGDLIREWHHWFHSLGDRLVPHNHNYHHDSDHHHLPLLDRLLDLLQPAAEVDASAPAIPPCLFPHLFSTSAVRSRMPHRFTYAPPAAVGAEGVLPAPEVPPPR